MVQLSDMIMQIFIFLLHAYRHGMKCFIQKLKVDPICQFIDLSGLTLMWHCIDLLGLALTGDLSSQTIMD